MCQVGEGHCEITSEWIELVWSVAISRRVVGINGFATGVGGQIVQYEKLVDRVVHGRKVNGGHGYSGRRPHWGWTAGSSLGLGSMGTSQSQKVVSFESDLETNTVMACKGHRRCLRIFRRWR